MKKLYKRTLMALAAVTVLSTLSASADDLTVNEGTEDCQYIPIYGWNFDTKGRTQTIYDTNQLAAMQGGTITSISFRYRAIERDAYENPNVTIYMGPADDDMFTTMAFLNNEGFTKVFEGGLEFDLKETPGDFVIQLTTPYVYNGGNLVVEIANEGESGAYSRTYWYGIKSESTTQSPSMYYGSGQAIYGNFYPQTTFTYNAPVVDGMKDVIDSNLSGDYIVVDLSGKTVARGNGNVRDAQRGLDAGMYIVRIGGKATKVMVR